MVALRSGRKPKHGGGTVKRARDHRVDALRGVALIMMFVDHIPPDFLNNFTMRNVGFADAAEVFVFLAGYASYLAYGRRIDRDGVWSGVKRILTRCVRIYLFQMGMVITTLLTIRFWGEHWPLPVDFLEPELANDPYASWWRTMIFSALPSNLNILPLYIVLLLCSPVMYLVMRWKWWVALGVSCSVWLLVNFDPSFNFPNWLDPDGWFFDPLAWQFLFLIGMFLASRAWRKGGDLPRHWWIVLPAVLYLLFSAVEVFPWERWGLPDLQPVAVPPSYKASLSPLRLLDVLAIIYLVQSSSRMRVWAESFLGQVMALFGRHSLEVFSAGTILDLLARLIFETFGDHWFFQVGLNVVGIGVLYVLAYSLDQRKKAKQHGAAA